LSPTALALTTGRAPRTNTSDASFTQAAAQPARDRVNVEAESDYAPSSTERLTPALSYDELAASEHPAGAFDHGAALPPRVRRRLDFRGRTRSRRRALAGERAPVLPPAAPARVNQPAAARAGAGGPQHATARSNKSSHSYAVDDDEQIHSDTDADETLDHAPTRPVHATAPHTAAARTAATAANGRDTRDAMAHTNGGTTQYATSATNTGPRGNDIAPQYPTAMPRAARDAAEAAAQRYAAPEVPVDRYSAASYEVIGRRDPVEEIREATLTPWPPTKSKQLSPSFRRLPLQLRPQRRHRRRPKRWATS